MRADSGLKCGSNRLDSRPMSSILILYSTVDGHTLTICRRIGQTLGRKGHDVTVTAIEAAGSSELSSFDKIVIGASIRYGRHRPSVFEFIDANLALLENRPSSFFTVNIVARKPEKSRPETNPYLKKFLQQTRWKPRLVDVFAGRLDYPRYRFFDRVMIQFIMRLTNGPTDPATVVEFTDWQRVDAFARAVCES
jgi:menaquinone-dependent protoporphyrinogen oxidase